MTSPFEMIGPLFILFFEGTNRTCLIYPMKNCHYFINNLIFPQASYIKLLNFKFCNKELDFVIYCNLQEHIVYLICDNG